MNYKYMIRFDNGKHYKSNREYVSDDYSYCDYECDATAMSEEDLCYLVTNKCLGTDCVVMIILTDTIIAEVRMNDIIAAFGG